jgi:hypothetical protein
VTLNGQLTCFDLNTYDYIAEQGNCGNANSEDTESGCVEKLLAAQSSTASATGVKAARTASGASSTASSLSASNGGARIPAGSLIRR